MNGEKIRVIPKDYQLDPVRDLLIHVDFLRVGEGARLTIAVPVHFNNHPASPGLKRGGVLNIVRHTIDMVVPADAIPEFVEVDLTGLDIGDSVHISAITLPEGVMPTIRDRNFTVATIAGAASALPDAEEGAPRQERRRRRRGRGRGRGSWRRGRGGQSQRPSAKAGRGQGQRQGLA